MIAFTISLRSWNIKKRHSACVTTPERSGERFIFNFFKTPRQIPPQAFGMTFIDPNMLKITSIQKGIIHEKIIMIVFFYGVFEKYK